MLGVPSLLATVASAAFSVPASVLCLETLAALLPARSEPRSKPASLRFAVLIPAHDEEGGIGDTVRAIRSELGPNDRVLVVADNCSDGTAQAARAAGAEVKERRDPDRRGKGHALTFGTAALAADPPDVVIVMDADCRVERGSLRELAELAATTGRPVQAVYLMHAKAGSGLTSISSFAFRVRNLVRPLGLRRLGFACQLTGTGMAFPWAVFRDAPPTEGFLVEDLLLGHELALKGTPPLLCETVQVGSDFPTSEAARLRQRRRWEHGELAVLLRTAPRMLVQGLLRRELGLIALGLDAAVPPVALLVMLEGAAVAGSAVFVLGGGSALPLGFALGGGALLAIGLSAAWLAHGRGVLPVSDIAKIPRYVLWKLPLYGSFARQGPHAEWERTERA
ncbi:MAG TPA: glycosyltransferase family 2 protein [Polyangiaceae bacterium]